MLRFHVHKNANALKSYLTNSLESGEYFVNERELPGIWGGQGAKLLGLSGNVEQHEFARLCENKHPQTGEPLTVRMKSNRRSAIEANFNPKKSLSVAVMLCGDEQVAEALRDSVSDVMAAMEKRAATRVRRGGQNVDRFTGNLVFAAFEHRTTRPVNGVPDPHVHFHVEIFNATHDAEEDRWKALQMGFIKKDAPYFQALFHSLLAEKLTKRGYELKRESDGFELAGISESITEKFSLRSKQIEDKAKALGIHQPKEKSKLGAKTREAKRGKLTGEDLSHAWWGRLSEEERSSLKRFTEARDARRAAIVEKPRTKKERTPPTTKAALRATDEQRRSAQRAVQFAIDHALERESVVAETRLLSIAMKEAGPSVPSHLVHSALQSTSLIRQEEEGRIFVTTAEVAAEEERMVAFARDGRGKCAPFVPPAQTARPRGLTVEQERAAKAVLSSYDRVTIVRGLAGSGKTTAVSAVREAIENAGKRVFAIGPAGADAATPSHRTSIARLEADKAHQKTLQGQVIWVDDANRLGTREVAKVFELASKQNARVILSGDFKKHRPVGRGDAFAILSRVAGVRSVTLKEIQRQRGALRSVTENLAKNLPVKAWDTLKRLDSLIEVRGEEKATELARQFVGARRSGVSALAVSATKKERERVTKAIRKELKAKQQLRGKDRTYLRLESLGLSVAERTQQRTYSKGQVICFSKPSRGFRSGERAAVLGRDGLGNVWVRGKLTPVILNLSHAERFDVFEQSKAAFAKGDTVRFTRNGRTADGKHVLRNGSQYRIKSFRGPAHDIVLENGWTVNRNHGHLRHGYCETSHGAQGRQADRVFVSLPKESLQAVSLKQFYTSVACAKARVQVFSDDLAALLEHIKHDPPEQAASDLLENQRKERLAHALSPSQQWSKGHEKRELEIGAF